MKFIPKKLLLIITAIFIVFNIVNAQSFTWKGSVNDADFFNEANWKNSSTNVTPTVGTIDPGKSINVNLIIQNAPTAIGGNSGIASDILFGSGSLTIHKSTLKMATGKGIDMGNATNTLTIDSALVIAEYLKNASTILSGDSKLYLAAANPFDAASSINITSNDAWLFAANLNAATAITSHIPLIKINGNALVDMTNARISQYYYGCAIAAYSSTFVPLRVEII